MSDIQLYTKICIYIITTYNYIQTTQNGIL